MGRSAESVRRLKEENPAAYAEYRARMNAARKAWMEKRAAAGNPVSYDYAEKNKRAAARLRRVKEEDPEAYLAYKRHKNSVRRIRMAKIRSSDPDRYSSMLAAKRADSNGRRAWLKENDRDGYLRLLERSRASNRRNMAKVNADPERRRKYLDAKNRCEKDRLRLLFRDPDAHARYVREAVERKRRRMLFLRQNDHEEYLRVKARAAKWMRDRMARMRLEEPERYAEIIRRSTDRTRARKEWLRTHDRGAYLEMAERARASTLRRIRTIIESRGEGIDRGLYDRTCRRVLPGFVPGETLEAYGRRRMSRTESVRALAAVAPDVVAGLVDAENEKMAARDLDIARRRESFRKVEEDMLLDEASRYIASMSWSEEEREYARSLVRGDGLCADDNDLLAMLEDEEE